MKKFKTSMLACLCCATVLVTGSSFSAFANIPAASLEPVLVYGSAVKEEGNRLHLSSSDSTAIWSEVVVTTSPETTRILDATTGLPVAFDDILEGETVYAYIGPAMTLSLPPISNASLVLCRIPADYKVPEFIKSTALDIHTDGSATLKAANGNEYTIPKDTRIFPYLTRNIVTVNDLTPGATCLIWTATGSNQASKVMVFPGSSQGSETEAAKTGWIQRDGSWLYYNTDGTLFTGWLLDNGSWYYLNSDGVMQTGFLTVDGKTYYLQDNGKMLTSPKTFTPDSNGELH